MAKQMTRYNRLTGYFNHLFDLINADFFGGALERPVITISPSLRSYAHYTPYYAWEVQGKGVREINIASGTLSRPLEEVIASLVHEMCHMYNDTVLNIQDCSSRNQYHNKHFRTAAESHGLRVERSEKYGWSNTSPGDELITWILENDLPEIEMSRIDLDQLATLTGGTNTTTTTAKATAASGNHYRRYVCPSCGLIARTTKDCRLACLECGIEMVRREKGEA